MNEWGKQKNYPRTQSSVLDSNILCCCHILFLADIIYGKITHTSLIRQNSQKFRSEAAYLPLITKNLVPNIDHEYFDYDHSDKTSRFFRTNEYGTIIGSKNNISKKHKLVLLFLGGSTTEANEVDEQFRFPALVEKILNDEYELTISTWNSGIRGQNVVLMGEIIIENNVSISAETYLCSLTHCE